MITKIQKLKEVNKAINELLEKLETKIFIEQIPDIIREKKIKEIV